MRWNLRLPAANRGVWQASDLQRLLAERGLVVSRGKMSHLWSGQPASIKLADPKVICTGLGCEVGELLIPEPETVPRHETGEADQSVAGERPAPRVVSRRRDGRSLPPT
ncbi:helix-turn-helix domain-containing protein [Amycolatopsis methanolica]|uniref:XRE family transcriptional regulator n=1 Tax=Amycolatopsis methanolica 239 TaxID=1068978 RepID=A0A076MSY8_AMYME|nr:helix-turn-helix transcriptional regulator [Amycolatopsis methanolica]AIJ21895.1 XRE family transcriptional regulator [Amycolatopsis methanolica 239]